MISLRRLWIAPLLAILSTLSCHAVENDYFIRIGETIEVSTGFADLNNGILSPALQFTISNPSAINIQTRVVNGYYSLIITAIIFDPIVRIEFSEESDAVRPNDIQLIMLQNDDASHVFTLKNTEKAEITISNKTESTATIEIRVNARVWHSMEDLIHYIRNLKPEYPNEPLYRKAWRLTLMETANRNPIVHADERQLDHPITLFNSLGNGICYNFSTSLYHIVTSMGYKARIMNNPEHTTLEIQDEGRWILLDPTFGVSYYKEPGVLAGLSDIRADPDIVERSKLDTQTVSLDWSRSQVDIAFSDNITRVFSSSNWLEASEKWYTTQSMPSSKIVLPPSSFFTFPCHEAADPEAFNDTNGIEINSYQHVKLTISTPPTQPTLITTGFMIESISGQGTVLVDGEITTLTPRPTSLLADRSTKAVKSIIATSETRYLEILSLANPRAISITPKTIIHISGTNSNILDIYAIDPDY